MSALPTNKFHIPDRYTKRLKLQTFSKSKKKLVISSNALPLFGFEHNARVTEEVIGPGEGLIVKLVDKDLAGTKKVYQRRYTKRKNNALEEQLDIRSQTKLNEALGDSEYVHITFTHGTVTIKPITSKQAERIKMAKTASDLLSAFVCCSSGIDAKSLHDNGFRMDTLLDRPEREKRQDGSHRDRCDERLGKHSIQECHKRGYL